MIGIIGAMSVEVDGLKACMTDLKIQTISGIDYYQGKIKGVDCVVAQCGIGKVHAAVCTQTMILLYHPDLIINTGVAGGIGQDIHIGDVVISSELVQHDMDTSAVGDEKGLISGINIVKIPASKSFVELVSNTAKTVYDGTVHVGVIATGDQFICDAKKLQAIADQFGAIACEMEGGSIAHVCYLNSTDYVVIRAISDNANEDASVDFVKFAEKAAQKSIQLICDILPQIK